jgi:hypothetical protein
MTANIHSKSEAFLSKVEPVRCQLQEWRRTRKHRERIPEGLWQAMSELARGFGVGRVCRALGVGYHALKERVEDSGKPNRSRNDQVAFVELPMPMPAPTPTPPRQSQCLVELEDGLGAKMTLRLAPGSGTEVLALVQAFWRKQP